MKYKIVLSLLFLMGISTLAAQETEYVPFVRERVKWVCYYENMGRDNYYDPYYSQGRNYFTLEMKGDTVIEGKCYKAIHKYSGAAINEKNDTIPLYLREENKIVYGIAPDGHHYPDLAVGYGSTPDIYQSVSSGEEFVLYDFNDPVGYYSSALWTFDLKFLGCNYIDIGNRHAKRYWFNLTTNQNFYIIEGVGFDEDQYVAGYPLGYVFSDVYHPNFHLSHVIEEDEIIYKSVNYKEPEAGEDYEYVPFVREGVKWVYYYNNPFGRDVLDMDEGIQYYSFEMKGDVLIGDKYYKPVVLTHYLDDNTKEVEDFIPVFLREEDKVVYAIHPDGKWYPQCPVGFFRYVGYKDVAPNYTSNEEFVLYDFNEPATFYDSVQIFGQTITGLVQYQGTDIIRVGVHHSKRHHYTSFDTDNGLIVEGIGYDGIAGMPLFYFELFNSDLRVEYFFSHVIEDNEIIYKGKLYDSQIHVGIGEVVADQSQRALDDNYYNLMGQPVGKEVPTTPGIYIHHGKKICVSQTP